MTTQSEPNDGGLDPDLRAAIHTLADKAPDLKESQRRHLRARLEAEMTTDPSHQTDTSRRRWVPAIAVAAVVAVAVGVTVAVNARDTGTDSAAEPATVQELLHEAADRLEAEGGEVVIPTADQWLYRRAGALISAHQNEISIVTDNWVNSDPEASDPPPGVYDPRVFADPVEVQQIYQDLPDDTAGVVDRMYELSDRFDPEAGFLTASPQVLTQEWVSHLRAFMTIAELLYAGDPPPMVQAKLYRALAEIPGVIDEGVVDDAIEDQFTDGQARQSHVIGWTWDFDAIDWPEGMEPGADWGLSARPQIVINPDTYHFQGQRWWDESVLDDNFRLAGLEIIFDTAIVDHRDELP